MSRTISRALLSSLVLLAQTITFAGASQPHGASELTGALALRMPYRGARPATETPKGGIGFFADMRSSEMETAYFGRLIATDWQANLYLYDPVTHGNKLSFLKCFDRHGRLKSYWRLLDANGITDATVTQDGTLWAVVDSDFSRTWPIIACKSKLNRPFLDWRTKLPNFVEAIISKLKNDGHYDQLSQAEKSNTDSWLVVGVAAAGKTIQIQISNSVSGYSHGIPINLLLTLNSDGTRVLKLRALKSNELHVGFQLGPDNILWNVARRGGSVRTSWDDLWLWQSDKKSEKPFLTYSEIVQPESWWEKIFQFHARQPAPAVIVDSKHNIYLEWGRRASGPIRKFTIGHLD